MKSQKALLRSSLILAILKDIANEEQEYEKLQGEADKAVPQG
jgi:hypothetical protein